MAQRTRTLAYLLGCRNATNVFTDCTEPCYRMSYMSTFPGQSLAFCFSGFTADSQRTLVSYY